MAGKVPEVPKEQRDRWIVWSKGDLMATWNLPVRPDEFREWLRDRLRDNHYRGFFGTPPVQYFQTKETPDGPSHPQSTPKDQEEAERE